MLNSNQEETLQRSTDTICLFICHCVHHLFCLAIGKAFSILNDPKKREQYDLYGQTSESQQQPSSRSSHQHYYAADDDEFSAEEIFNMFFGYAGKICRVL
jgi:hypothetical protein